MSESDGIPHFYLYCVKLQIAQFSCKKAANLLDYECVGCGVLVGVGRPRDRNLTDSRFLQRSTHLKFDAIQVKMRKSAVGLRHRSSHSAQVMHSN